MTIGLTVVLRNNRLDEITADLDSSVASPDKGMLRIYSLVRPANADAALNTVSPEPVLLAELTFSNASFPAAAGGTMSANAIADDTSANATGVANWFRVVDGDGNTVMDGDISVAGASPLGDLILNTTSINSGATVSVTSFVLTEGNA